MKDGHYVSTSFINHKIAIHDVNKYTRRIIDEADNLVDSIMWGLK